MKKKDNLANDAAMFFLVAVISVSLSVFASEVNTIIRDSAAQAVGATSTPPTDVTELQNNIVNLQAQLASISRNPQDATTTSIVSNLQVQLATSQAILSSLSPQVRPAISVLFPNGGETLEAGKTYRIKWQASPDIDKINLAYTYNYGNTSKLDWICVACANTGFFDWDVKVASATSTQTKIDLTGFKTGYGSVNDQSDNFLTVTPAKLITGDAPPKISLNAWPTAVTPGTISLLMASSSDDKGVAGVQFKVNGAQYGAEVKTAPYTISFVPPKTSDPYNSYQITAVARDTAGQIGFSNALSILVVPGTTSTTSVKGVINAAADSSDPSFSGIKNVVVPASGAKVAKFKFTGVTSAFTVDELKLKIPNNASTSTASVTVKYKNKYGEIQTKNTVLALPFGREPYATATFTGLGMYVPQNGDSFLEVYVDLVSVNNGAKPGAALTVTLDHSIGFKAVSVSDASIVSFFGSSDVVGLGTIIITAPSPSSSDSYPSVSLSVVPSTVPAGGTVNFIAEPSDDKGVAGVQFKINGVDYGPEVTSYRYSISYVPQTANIGTSTITAVARDTAGQKTTSNSVTLVVTPKPTGK